MHKPVILLLNGPGGAGKTTVSHMVAKKLEKCAIVDADVVRHMIAVGFIDPFRKEGVEQYTLGMYNTALLARSFYEAGFNVVIDGGATRKEYLDIYYDELRGVNLVNVLLFPSKQSLIERDAVRSGSKHLGEEKITWLYDRFSIWQQQEDRWTVLDSSGLTPTQTTKILFERLGSGSVRHG